MTFLLYGNGQPQLEPPVPPDITGRCNHGIGKGYADIWFNGLLLGHDEVYGDEFFSRMVRTNGEKGGVRLKRHKPTKNPVDCIDPDVWKELNKRYRPLKLTTGSMAAWWVVTQLGFAPKDVYLSGFNFYKGEGTVLGNGTHNPEYDEKFVKELGVVILGT